MSETVQSFLDRVKEAVTVLREPDVIELIEAVKNQSHASKLRLLIVGATVSGRFSVANVLLEQPNLLPTSSIPKAPISLSVSYGEPSPVEVFAQNGIRTVIPVENLKTFLTSPDIEAREYLGIEVKTNCNLLKTCALRIESLDNKKSEAQWKELLAGTEYAVLVLNATAILSEQEKKFIRDILKPNLGLERVAILLNQIDRVSEEERSSISELVRAFLGPFESQPVLIEFSALQASNEISSGNTSTDSGYAVLSQLVKIDLVEQHSFLKSIAIFQAAEICLTEVEERATRQNALIVTKETELEELRDKSDLQSQWLKSRIQRAQKQTESFINTLIKEEFFVKIEGFSLALEQQLPSEVMPIKDVTQVRRYLPGYLERIWADFFNLELEEIRSKLSDEIKLIGEMFEDDLKELLGDKVTHFQNLVGEFDPTATNLGKYWMPQKSTSVVGYSVLAGGLGVQLFAKFSKLIVPIASVPFIDKAIGMVGGLFSQFGKTAIGQSDKQAILESAIKEFPKLEKSIQQQVESQFAELTKELKQAIDDLYTEEVNKINQVLTKAVESHQELVARKGEIEELIGETIPELRRLLGKLG
ncbi:MAG: hypothetical protein F6K40_06265 [Okeania sp. SIO3I5]|uniref:hypothetical protein n=1 Tax=Okeania sp. SIO3I5 TaxID=2607805 RepID=UPI0013B6D25E|nr:hypothetical protein [Okeania sp. SIO3I5]NEQ35911.1 hypothetical protein [Okeania sp. SIO3I5]